MDENEAIQGLLGSSWHRIDVSAIKVELRKAMLRSNASRRAI